jgi:hypothetical protein
MEDVQLCLSYTLFNMIKRRHYGYQCAEQGDALALQFVLTGFSDGQIDRPGIRAFEVVEVQLAFLYDHFFIEHLQLDVRRSPAQSMSLPLIGVLFMNAFVQLFASAQEGVPAHTAVRGLVGGLLLCILGVQECFLSVSHFASDSYKVWCVWQRHCSCYQDFMVSAQRKIGEWLAQTISWPRNRYWQNMIGQYSLIEDCDNISVKKTVLAWLSQYLLDECYDFISHHPLEMDPVKVSASVHPPSLNSNTTTVVIASYPFVIKSMMDFI